MTLAKSMDVDLYALRERSKGGIYYLMAQTSTYRVASRLKAVSEHDRRVEPNGDGDFADAGIDVDDDRAHNPVNEITT